MHFNKSNNNQSTVLHQGDVPYITFPKLDKAGLVHGFSTRIGGVSEGIYASMNLSYTCGDDEEKVDENFRRIGKAIGFKSENLVFSNQIHKTDIAVVTSENCGSVMTNMDGLVTKEKGVPLYTGYVDCVPLFFYDPEKKVAGMAHSGWRGTVGRIGANMIEVMGREFACDVKDIVAAVGPSICQDCYEISEDVALEFIHEFQELPQESYLIEKGNGKFQLDLWKVNEHILKEAGITEEHLDVTDVCTCCNHKLLFSHRASKGKRGNLGGFVVL